MIDAAAAASVVVVKRQVVSRVLPPSSGMVSNPQQESDADERLAEGQMEVGEKAGMTTRHPQQRGSPKRAVSAFARLEGVTLVQIEQQAAAAAAIRAKETQPVKEDEPRPCRRVRVSFSTSSPVADGEVIANAEVEETEEADVKMPATSLLNRSQESLERKSSDFSVSLVAGDALINNRRQACVLLFQRSRIRNRAALVE
uniref:Uncharacterized protein n=1 Tax=Schistocephalus solidus TaxID=70667 RepID=A0A0V0JCU8_SCHSO